MENFSANQSNIGMRKAPVRLTHVDTPTQRGTLQFEEGMYEGSIEYGMKNGLGSFLWYNGNFYNGHWKDDEMEGPGTLYYAKGGRLKGMFLKGKLEGFGKGLYPNGDCYLGIWKEGKFHGKGIYYRKEADGWVSGEFKEGNLISEQSKGEGKPASFTITLRDSNNTENIHEITWDDQLLFNQYTGEVLHGKRHGNGLYVFSNNSFYEGQWKDNLPNGLGSFHYQDGKFDAGIYVGGHLDGYGIAQYENGDVYEGYFQKGLRNGFGILSEISKGRASLGFYTENALVSPVKIFTEISPEQSFRKLEREYIQQIAQQQKPVGAALKDDPEFQARLAEHQSQAKDSGCFIF